MKFEYTGRHIEVTPALRSHVENHFKKITHLFNGSSTSAHVIIEVEKGRHRSEIVVKLKDHILTANSTVSDMYVSLSKSIDKIEKQALKIKTKVIDKHHKAKRAAAKAVDVSAIKDDAKPTRIVNTRRYKVKPMTPDEAALELNGQKDQFVVFRDSFSQKISVIYKRADGNYGLIQP
jgi:putative sigma-54 modulation protein